MAYKSANLTLHSPRLGTGENLAADDGGYASAKFVYRAITADDNLAAMQAVGFISDGDDQGIAVGDCITFIEDTVAAENRLVTVVDAAGLVTTIAFA